MKTARGPIVSCSVLALQGVVPSPSRQPLASEALFEARLSQGQQGGEPAPMAGEGDQPGLLPWHLQRGTSASVADEKPPALEAAREGLQHVTRHRPCTTR